MISLSKFAKNITLAAIAALAAPGALALPVDAYPAESPLASGQWVRVTTPAEGIFQFSHAQLRELGFADPSKVSVWTVDQFELGKHTFSEGLAAGLHTVASTHTADGRLLFYGQGDSRVVTRSLDLYSDQKFTYERNYYTTSGSYFLTDHEAPALSVAPRTEASAKAPLKTHIHTELLEEELWRPVGGGVRASGKKYNSGDAIPFTFRVKNWEKGGADSLGLFNYFLDVAADGTARMKTSVTANARCVYQQDRPSVSVSYPTAFDDADGWMLFAPKFGTNLDDDNVTFSVQTPSISYNFISADRAMIAYPRSNRLDAEDPALVMTFSKFYTVGQELRFPASKAANVRLWLVDKPFEYTELPAQEGTDEAAGENFVSFVLPRLTTRAVAFDPTATFPSPDVVGQVPNSNLIASDVPDLLIVTTDALAESAHALADLHRKRSGLDVLVVTQKQVNNEFAAGTPHAMGLKLFAKSLYDRNPAKFRYLLLFGPSFNDARGIENTPEFETLVAYETDNLNYCMSHILCYTSDSYFGILADDVLHTNLPSQPAQVAVGRVSARMPSQARDYVKKATAWFDNPPTPDEYASAVLVSGKLNKNEHVNHTLEVRKGMLAARPEFTFTMVPHRVIPLGANNDQTINHNILYEALRRGAGYLSYSGHGAINFIDHESLLSTNTVLREPYSRPPFTMLASCAQFTFDNLGTSLLESMVLARQGGAIGGVAACREVYLTYNQYTCLAVGESYAAAKPGATIGSVFLDARRRVLSRINAANNTPWVDPGELINNMCYNLAGDPAMPLYVPAAKAVLDSTEPFRPLATTTLTGSVLDAEGNVDKTFNGSVRIRVLDGPNTVETLAHGEKPFTSISFDIENDLIGSSNGRVVNGRFEVKMAVNDPLYTADAYNLTISATRDDAPNQNALGCAKISLLELDPADLENTSAPVINALYANDPAFCSGDLVDPSFTLFAEIDAGATGINFATAGVTARTSLMVDGVSSYSGIEGYISRRPDGSYYMAMPFAGLSDGYHSLELTVANNAGLVSRSSIDIMVMDRDLSTRVLLAENCVRTEAEISLETSSDTTVAERLVVQDAHGNTVHTAQAPAMPYRWSPAASGCDAGEYTVRLFVSDARARAEATPARLVYLP